MLRSQLRLPEHPQQVATSTAALPPNVPQIAPPRHIIGSGSPLISELLLTA